MRTLLAVIGVLFSSAAAFAVEPDEMLDDPALETRAQEIDMLVRCVVCQSQPIGESNAPLAKDMRILVRERLVAGDTNEETLDYLVERYGDYVLLKPKVQTNTLFLWAFPAIALIAGLATAAIILRRPQARVATPLSEEDNRKIDHILDERG